MSEPRDAAKRGNLAHVRDSGAHVKNIVLHAENIAVFLNIIATHASFPYACVLKIAALPNNIAAIGWKVAALLNNIAVHVRLPYARAWKIAVLVKNIGVHARNSGVHAVPIEERHSSWPRATMTTKKAPLLGLQTLR